MNDSSPERSRSTRLLAPVLLIVVALLVIQSARVLSAVSQLENDARALKTLADQDTTSLDAVFASDDLGALMAQTEEDLRAVRAVFGPLVNVAPWLGWLPRYGGDLANAPALLDFGESVAAGAQKTLSVAHTFNAAFEAGRAANAPLGATLLQSAQAQTPTILAAQTDLAQALQARARVDVAQLSP